MREKVRVEFGGAVIADSMGAYRVLETSHPPTIYIPREDIRMGFLRESPRNSFCEWKGQTVYLSVVVGDREAKDAAWTYPTPSKPFADIAGYVSFYPSRVDACTLGEERVEAQAGDFYGGWITSKITGPFKGSPGTWGW